MLIKIHKEDSSLKITSKGLNEESKKLLERVSSDSYIQELHKIFQEYQLTLLDYEEKKITRWEKGEITLSLFNKSGYQDIYDFYFDYRRWIQGLPIIIEFELI